MLKRLAAFGGIATAVVGSILVLLLSAFFEPLREDIGNILKPNPAITNISKVVDGHQKVLLPKGKTPSAEITFFFEAIENGKIIPDIQHFECKLEPLSSQFTQCESGNNQNYHFLKSGDYIFSVKVKDTNTKKPSSPNTFRFTILPSNDVIGTIQHNSSSWSGFKITMDNQFIGDDIDDFGTFYILGVNSTTQDHPIHNFTIHDLSKNGQQTPCIVTKPIEPSLEKLVDVGLIQLNKKCHLYLNMGTLSGTSSITPVQYDTFKSEKFNTASDENVLYNTHLDLLYNTTLIRKPTSTYSEDGIWKTVIYVDGLDLDKVSKITYYLHPTFKPSNVRTETSENNPNFALHLSVYGGFKLFAKVYLKDGGIIDLTRYILLDY